jgi:hypothetical protein
MPIGRWIEYTRKSMQRLGYLRTACILAPVTRGTTLDGIAARLYALVSRKIHIRLRQEPEVWRYIVDRQLFRTRYSDFPADRAVADQDLPEHEMDIEIQDYYLAQDDIPSRTGNLTPEIYDEIINWGTSLGLLRDVNYSLLARGQLLLPVSPIDNSPWTDLLPAHNPFRLSVREQVLFLYLLMEWDGDVLCRLYPKVLRLEQPFHRSAAGDLLPMVFRDVYAAYRSRVQTTGDLTQLRNLLDQARFIEERIGKPSDGTGRTREQRITVRLEPFVDLGLLSKPNPVRYEYLFTSAGQAFFENLPEPEKLAHFLENSFFSAAAHAHGIPATEKADPAEIVASLFASYNLLRSATGYAPVIEVLLDASLRGLVSESPWFIELSTGLEAIREVQRRHPGLLRFNIDRQGNLRYIKLESSLIHELYDQASL